ncbi:MAG: phage late control D family protein, partial [Candidatus Fimenecus sp.]
MEDNGDTESQQEMEEKGYTLPEYAFTIECGGEKSEESPQLDIKDEIKITVSNFEKLKGKTLRLSWKDGSSKTITIASQKLIVKDIFIGSA